MSECEWSGASVSCGNIHLKPWVVAAGVIPSTGYTQSSSPTASKPRPKRTSTATKKRLKPASTAPVEPSNARLVKKRARTSARGVPSLPRSPSLTSVQPPVLAEIPSLSLELPTCTNDASSPSSSPPSPSPSSPASPLSFILTVTSHGELW